MRLGSIAFVGFTCRQLLGDFLLAHWRYVLCMHVDVCACVFGLWQLTGSSCNFIVKPRSCDVPVSDMCCLFVTVTAVGLLSCI